MNSSACDELVVIAPYFNPCHYITRKNNYDIFSEGINRSGVRCITVECAFGDDDFEICKTPDVMRVRARDVLWQKERLVNLGVASLPRNYKYVAILDADILFANEHWMDNLIDVMQVFPIAQVYEWAFMLGRDGSAQEPVPGLESFSSAIRDGRENLIGQSFLAHGHTGFGWVIHRKILDGVGLYEAAINGAGDHFLAHACFNDYGQCVTDAFRGNARILEHLKAWGERFYPFVKGRVGFVPGYIWHLWHGDSGKRRYYETLHQMIEFGFDPWTDLKAVGEQPLEWADDLKKPDLQEFVSSYLAGRDEDGLQE